MRNLTQTALSFALLLCVALSSEALAAKKKKTAGKEKNREVAEETTSAPAKKGRQDVKFSGLKLKGDLKKPDLSYIYKRSGLRAEQIVNIPVDFNDEIQQGENQF